ncbi:MAG: hypothetical protein IJ134_04895 [Bacilli bacterium]|nr:hypothetical protein [Bacilli bacterium]
MINKSEIEISLIKNLDLIYFYNIQDSNHIGLNIVYDNGKNLNYNYTYEYFIDYLAKVVSVYKKEKDTRNIQFLDEESKSIIDSFCNKDFKLKKVDNLQPKLIKYNTRAMDVKFLHNYITNAMKSLIDCFIPDVEIFNSTTNIYGNKDRYVLNIYYNRDYYTFRIPLVYIKSSDNRYIFKARVNECTIFSRLNVPNINIDGSFDIYNDCVALTFNSSDITGKFIYHNDSSKSIEIIKHNDDIISYKKDENNEVNNEIIDFYLNLLKLPNISKRVKTVDNCYLLVDEIDNTKYFIHMCINNNYVNVKVEISFGIKKNDLFIPLEKEKQNINIILEPSNNIVIERQYLPTDISDSYYKSNLENKCTYEFYKIDECDLKHCFKYEKKLIK